MLRKLLCLRAWLRHASSPSKALRGLGTSFRTCRDTTWTVMILGLCGRLQRVLCHFPFHSYLFPFYKRKTNFSLILNPRCGAWSQGKQQQQKKQVSKQRSDSKSSCFSVEKVKHSNDWVTNPFVSQLVFNSLLSTKLKEDLMKLSAGRALKIFFDDRSPHNFWQITRKSLKNWVMLL